MSDQRVADILCEVLAAMEKSHYARLAETGVFLSSGGTEPYDAVRRILEEDARLTAELAARTGNLHYLDLHFVLTEVLRSKEQLLAVAESALAELTGTGPAGLLVSKIAAAHRDHIVVLERLIARTGSSAPRP